MPRKRVIKRKVVKKKLVQAQQPVAVPVLLEAAVPVAAAVALVPEAASAQVAQEQTPAVSLATASAQEPEFLDQVLSEPVASASGSYAPQVADASVSMAASLSSDGVSVSPGSGVHLQASSALEAAREQLQDSRELVGAGQR